ncbi:hypothetical protein [Umezawaea beigongshangensis]|uniref:hypothetical protein n=1 Tax=Umezawaea beigongshangensis TaxID=2780383 RepID=UPI0018F18F1B|nr:hypothetical protein [Umezawaea beigongshangensis]
MYVEQVEQPGTPENGKRPIVISVNGKPVPPLGLGVGNGTVSLEPGSGEKLRAMLQEQMDKVDAWLSGSGHLVRQPPLGTNEVAWAMSTKFESRAEGEPNSFVSVVSSYRTVLQQTYDSVVGAIENYQRLDETHRESLRRSGKQ